MRLWTRTGAVALCASLAAGMGAQQPAPGARGRFAPELQQYIQFDETRVVLTHVRVIDGTGRAALDDQNIVVEDGRIAAIQPGADVAPTPGTRIPRVQTPGP